MNIHEYQAKELLKKFNVPVQEGIPVTLITDNMAAPLMRTGAVDLVIVGADRDAGRFRRAKAFDHDFGIAGVKAAGDVGARHVIGRYPEAMAEVPVADKAVFVDVDTPELLQKVKAEIERR